VRSTAGYRGSPLFVVDSISYSNSRSVSGFALPGVSEFASPSIGDFAIPGVGDFASPSVSDFASPGVCLTGACLRAYEMSPLSFSLAQSFLRCALVYEVQHPSCKPPDRVGVVGHACHHLRTEFSLIRGACLSSPLVSYTLVVVRRAASFIRPSRYCS
jgi:hypothetical protein